MPAQVAYFITTSISIKCNNVIPMLIWLISMVTQVWVKYICLCMHVFVCTSMKWQTRLRIAKQDSWGFCMIMVSLSMSFIKISIMQLMSQGQRGNYIYVHMDQRIKQNLMKQQDNITVASRSRCVCDGYQALFTHCEEFCSRVPMWRWGHHFECVEWWELF